MQEYEISFNLDIQCNNSENLRYNKRYNIVTDIGRTQHEYFASFFVFSSEA